MGGRAAAGLAEADQVVVVTEDGAMQAELLGKVRYVAGQVRERPLAATGIALGVGVLIGLILAGGRNR